MNNSWHPDCFCCDICQAVLADVGFVKNAGRSVFVSAPCRPSRKPRAAGNQAWGCCLSPLCLNLSTLLQKTLPNTIKSEGFKTHSYYSCTVASGQEGCRFDSHLGHLISTLYPVETSASACLYASGSWPEEFFRFIATCLFFFCMYVAFLSFCVWRPQKEPESYLNLIIGSDSNQIPECWAGRSPGGITLTIWLTGVSQQQTDWEFWWFTSQDMLTGFTFVLRIMFHYLAFCFDVIIVHSQ